MNNNILLEKLKTIEKYLYKGYSYEDTTKEKLQDLISEVNNEILSEGIKIPGGKNRINVITNYFVKNQKNRPILKHCVYIDGTQYFTDAITLIGLNGDYQVPTIQDAKEANVNYPNLIPVISRLFNSIAIETREYKVNDLLKQLRLENVIEFIDNGEKFVLDERKTKIMITALGLKSNDNVKLIFSNSSGHLVTIYANENKASTVLARVV